MTRIRASCPDCGEVDLFPNDVVLRLVRAPDGEVTDGSCYRFSCPACEGTVTKPADERIAELLATGGVAIEETDEADAGVDSDLRPPHPESPPPGPAFTLDDVLDLHLLLTTETWFDDVLATSR